MISIATKRLLRISVASALPILIASATLPARAAVGEWHGEGPAQVRLIAAGIDAEGRIAAGIEIALEPGWKTYWRSPGDAGIAPLTDFSASTNIDGPVRIGFPVPRRYDDGYAVTHVYEDHVVFVVDAVAADPGAPTALALALDIGVCAEICIPEHFELTLDLTPGAVDADAEAVLAEARAELPRPPVPGVFDVDAITRAGGADARPMFEISLVAPDAREAEVFVEGPVDWYPAPPKLVAADNHRATFSFQFSRLGSNTPVGGNAFRVTVEAAGSAIEDIVVLD